MPKGVDHHIIAPAPEASSNLVQKSLMPKGVDHATLEAIESKSSAVQKSLMPKGVDHTAPVFAFEPNWVKCKNL